MKYVFEDKRTDIISQFFMQAYPNKTSDEFIYTEGNGELKGVLSDLLLNTSENIIVYMDAIPGNKDITKIYKELGSISIKNSYRAIILPIVCSEYYLIQYLNNENILTDKTGVDIALNKDFYKNSPLLNTQQNIDFVKNFEKYCKLITMTSPRLCANLSKRNAHGKYKIFYTQDCICKVRENNCTTNINKIDKSINFISQYPCVPSKSHSKNYKSFTIEQVWDIHRQLVSEFNQMVNKYKTADPANANLYKPISVIK